MTSKSIARKETKNIYCERAALSNEATVEQFFVNRLLEDLGYQDKDIKPKSSLASLKVGRGSKIEKYKPDYALDVAGNIRWIVEAKATSELIDDHIEQCSGYCLALNRKSKGENPTEYFLISNGVETAVFAWDDDTPLVRMEFKDFVNGNSKFKRLKQLLGRDEIAAAAKPAKKRLKSFDLNQESISEINAHFSWCHQYIHRKDSLSQSAAFLEFVKLVFLKLLSDRRYHEIRKLAPAKVIAEAEIPFTITWIEQREGDHHNPLSDVQFKNLLSEMEREIQDGKRKRIFNASDSIALSAETIKGVVKRLQYIDLIGIDADLNGRLFETFLNATMRGKDLGQFFTPRSIVKLATAIADPVVERDRQDVVFDACCGSGGFLIEALAYMWSKADQNPSLSAKEKEALKKRIANNSIYGDDISRDPPLARIARMNMYLHGDGGSRIFEADILDKNLSSVAEVESLEVSRAKEELRAILSDPEAGFADVVLTNPPFAKEYHRKDPRDRAILEKYTLAAEAGTKRWRPSVRSSVLFLERYLDILKPGGRMIAIIDESILGSRKYADVRDWLREKFLIRAVISLPGDAFQRSLARVKTSIIYLVRKASEDDEQGHVFMSWAVAVGNDDPARVRVLPGDAAVRAEAVNEIARISSDLRKFLDGKLTRSTAHVILVPPGDIQDRLDVKHCAIAPGRQVRVWKQKGIEVQPLSELVSVSEAGSDVDDNDE
jgi:type I restriction enzyme M protein